MLQLFAAIIIALTIVLSLCPAIATQGLQSPSHLSDKQRLADSESRAVQSVIDRAEQHYKLGELSLRDRNYAAARGEFDKAVDAVLESGIDVRSNPRLQTYYLSLVERVYRTELPPLRRGEGIVTRAGAGEDPPAKSGLLREQKFEPSPLDDLARLDLAAGEGDVSGSPPRRDTEVCRTAALRGVALRGFTLGMSEAEVRRRLPRLQVKGDRHGLSSGVFFVGRSGPPPAELKGITGMAFTFMEGRVARVVVGYDDSIRWDSLEEFTERTAEALRLPKAWQPYRHADYTPRRGLFCDDVSLVTYFASLSSTGKSPVLTLEDRTALDTFTRRVKAAEEQRRRAEERKKQTFKP